MERSKIHLTKLDFLKLVFSLMLLIASLVFFSYQTIQTARSSDILADYVIEYLKPVNVTTNLNNIAYVEKEVMRELNALFIEQLYAASSISDPKDYDSTNIPEFMVCAIGEVKDGNVYIHNLTSTEWKVKGIGLEFIKCPGNSLGTIHSHPPNHCELSLKDIYTFGALRDYVMGLICNTDTLLIFTLNNLNESLEVRIA